MARMRWIATIGAAVGLLALPAAASAEVLYDQTAGASPPNATAGLDNFAPSNEFSPTDFDRTADDFTVPAGATWAISGITVTGAFSGSPTNLVNVFLYADGGGKPGPEVFSRQDIVPTGGPNYAISLAGVPNLTGGTYWVTVQQVASGGYWSWGTNATLHGAPAQLFSMNSPGPGCPAITWSLRSTCYSPGSSPDQTFTLEGEDLTPSPPSNQFQIGRATRNLARGTARVPVTVPGTGGITLRGPQVIARQRNVLGARTVRIVVAARGAAKQRLNRTGTARVKVRVTFRPGGGTARTKTRFVRLRKRLN